MSRDSSIVLRAENVGKRFRIPPSSAPAPHRGLSSLAFNPLKLFKEIRSLTHFDSRDEETVLWALRDVNFEVKRGEVLGIIGHNGAGKSTLLKILSQITSPTTGRIEINGRISSLLEVGTGFHPELTGRENIYMNGTLHGMSKREIDRKFDEIVDFAGVERFIDMPVKRYSSGMGVRLGFAVAAFLEPEILLLDEVLAVGDAAFQHKCLGKMGQVTQQGRTVFFVSHNFGAVAQLCDRAILMDHGRIIADGTPSSVIADYQAANPDSSSTSDVSFPTDPQKNVQFVRVRVLDHRGECSAELDRSQPFYLEFEYEVRGDGDDAVLEVILEASHMMGQTILFQSRETDLQADKLSRRGSGRYRACVSIPGQLLNAGTYRIRPWIWKKVNDPDVHDEWKMGMTFRLHDHGTFASMGEGGRQRPGILALPLEWKTQTLS